jgi:hypothetical protein
VPRKKANMTPDEGPNFLQLTERCNTKDPAPEDVAALRKKLDEQPEIALHPGNQMIAHTFDRILAGNGLTRALYVRQIEEKRRSMEYDQSNAFIKMLIDQVVLSYVRLNQMEVLHEDRLAGNHSSEHGYYWDSRLASAQRRFLRACEALGKVKKLLAESQHFEEKAYAAGAKTLLRNVPGKMLRNVEDPLLARNNFTPSVAE